MSKVVQIRGRSIFFRAACVALVGLLACTGSAGADIYVWTGAAGTSHMEDANWRNETTGQANQTVSGSGHRMEFRGETAGVLNISYGAEFGAPTGHIYWLTAGQTAGVTITNRDSEPQELRLLRHDNTFQLAEGAGPLTLGGTGGEIRLVLDGASGSFGLTNHSDHPLTFSTNVVWTMASSATHTLQFKGKGDIVVDGSVIGSGGDRRIRKENGTGTLTLGGDNSDYASGGEEGRLLSIDLVQGMLVAAHTNALGSGRLFAAGGTVLCGGGATLGGSLTLGHAAGLSIDSALTIRGNVQFRRFSAEHLFAPDGSGLDWSEVADGVYSIIGPEKDADRLENGEVVHTIQNLYDLGDGRYACFLRNRLSLVVFEFDDLLEGASLPQITIETNRFYYARLALETADGIEAALFRGELVARDGEGIETVLAQFGAGSDGVSFGHAWPLVPGQMREHTLMWNSGLHPHLAGQELLFRAEGWNVSRVDIALESESGPVPSNEAVWRKNTQTVSDPGIASVTLVSHFYGFNSGVNRPVTGQDHVPAYNYSVNPVYDTEEGVYRLFTGGRWRDTSVQDILGRNLDGDHSLQHISATGEGFTWQMPHDPPRPEFKQGRFEGARTNDWWAGNYMDMQAVKVDGTWYYYTQVQVNAGQILDPDTGLLAETQADRIQLHTSSNATDWTRWSTNRGVVVEFDEPEKWNLTHHEVIYLPWEQEQPWRFYVNAFYMHGTPQQTRAHFMIKSDDPTTFDWRERVQVSGFAGLGNQTGYCRQAPTGPLFVRMAGGGTVDGRPHPGLSISRDGINWTTLPGVVFDGSRNDNNNPNNYFFGFSTLDGTGELESIGDGWYRGVYGVTTSRTSVSPEIFSSLVGTGIFYLYLEPHTTWWTGAEDGGDLLKAGNWENGLPDPGRIAVWNGTQPGPLDLTFDSDVGGTQGWQIYLPSAQTGELALKNASTSNQNLRLKSVPNGMQGGSLEMEPGSGALTIGGGMNPMQVLLGGSGSVDGIQFVEWRNNSTNALTVASNVTINSDVTSNHGVALNVRGTGDYIFENSWTRTSGNASATLGLSVYSSGTTTLAGDTSSFARPGFIRVAGNGTTIFTEAKNIDGFSAIRLGFTGMVGTLRYEGTANTTIISQTMIGEGGGQGTIENNSETGTLTFSANPFNQQVAQGNNLRTFTLSGNNTGANTVAGQIQNYEAIANGRITAVTKTGPGRWVLGGANSYTGPTAVNEGALIIDGNQSGATNTVTVASGAAIGGNGTIGGDLAMDDGARLVFNPNATLTVAGATTFAGSFDPNGLVLDDGLSWDQIGNGIYTLVAGNVDFTKISTNWVVNMAGSGKDVRFQPGSLNLEVRDTARPTISNLDIALDQEDAVVTVAFDDSGTNDYTLQFSTNLVTGIWTDVATGSVSPLRVTNDIAQGFFRVKAE